MNKEKILYEMPMEAKEQALIEFKADILTTISRIARFKNIDDVDIESHYNYNKDFVFKRGLEFLEIHKSLYYACHTFYCIQDILPLLISSPIIRRLDYMFGEAELAFSYFYVCQKNDKYDEAIRYIYHGYVNLNAHNESLLHYIEHHLDERVEEKEFIPFKESFSSLAFDINTICGLINIVPKFEDMEDEFEDVEDKRGYRSLHFANEIGYNIELVHDMAKLLISNNANSVLIDKIRAIMHVMKSYNETSRLIARSGFNGGILGHDDSNEIIFLSVEKGITRMKERLPELENLAGLCSVEADNVLWNPAPTLESKENGQVITVNLRDFQKQTGGHVNLLRDLEQQLPGNPIQLKPARHRKNGVSNLKRSLRSKGYEELANQIRQEKVGSHYEVVCKIRIKLKE